MTVSVSGGKVNANQEGTSYTATASVSDKNYVIKAGSETTSFTIKPKTITEEMVALSGGILKGDSYEYAFTKGKYHACCYRCGQWEDSGEGYGL